MKILQIYNHIPEALTDCIASVKRYANRAGAEYVLIADNPDPRYEFVTAWADKIQLDYLSKNPDTLYVDWDVEIFDNFEIGGNIALFGDQFTNLVWNGNQCDIFSKVLDKYLEFEAKAVLAKKARYHIWKKFNKMPIAREHQINPETYIHYLYGKNKGLNIRHRSY